MIHIAEAVAMHGKFVELTYVPSNMVRTGWLGFYLDSMILYSSAEDVAAGLPDGKVAHFIGDAGSRKNWQLKDLSEVKVNQTQIQDDEAYRLNKETNDIDGNASHYLNN